MENGELGKLDRFKGRPFEVKRARRKWVVLSGSFLVGLFLLIYFLIIPRASSPPPAAPLASVTPTSQEPQLHTVEGEVRRTKHSFPILNGEEHSSSMDRSDHFQIEVLCKF